MNRQRGLFYLVCIFLISACGTTAPVRPLWIDNAATLYPDNIYLSAVGQAATRARASKNAVANLAEIFYVKVAVETTLLTESTKQQSALGVSMQASTALRRNIQTSTDIALSGVSIKQSWQSPTGEVYALALLSKPMAAQRLKQSIFELDDSTQSLIAYSVNTAPNSIAALNALRRARDEQIARKMANLQLTQVSFSGIPVDISSENIEMLITQKLASMRVSVVNGDTDNSKMISAALAELGMTVSDNANIVVTGEVTLSDVFLKGGWYWLRGSYALSISEGGKAISRQRWPIKISSKEKSLLEFRFNETLSANSPAYLRALLSDIPTP